MEMRCDLEHEKGEIQTMSRQDLRRMIPNMQLKGQPALIEHADVTSKIMMFQNRNGVSNMQEPLYLQNITSICFNVDHMTSG